MIEFLFSIYALSADPAILAGMKHTSPAEDVKLLAIDLDDTLLNEALEISVENRRALIAAEKAGVAVVLASGRAKEAMWRYALQLGMDKREGYMVCSNGALIIRTDTQEEVVRHTVNIGKGLEAYQYVHAQGIPMIIYHDGKIVSDLKTPWVEVDSRLSGLPIEIVDDFASFVRENPPLKLLIEDDAKIIQRLLPVLRERWGADFHIVTSKPYFLELLPLSADKGHALRYLSELLEIPSERIMAIGDAHNDVGMIRFAGLGVAVGNALDEVKAAADIVLDRHHEDHAVAHAVHTYILGNAECC